MLPMIGVALGAASFVVAFWMDFLSLKKVHGAKPVFLAASLLLFIGGLVLSLQDPGRLLFPPIAAVTGLVLLVLFAALLAYSLFFEIPFLAAYVRDGHPARVVSTGTYALCRHPGVLWLAGFLAGLFLLRGSRWLLLAMPVWVGLDALYVVLQERLFFIPMFGTDYEVYQREVPMLIPTVKSIRRFLATVFRRVHE